MFTENWRTTAMGLTKHLAPATVIATLVCAGVGHAQTVEYYHLDPLGSVRAVTSQGGQVVERHDYLPFGEEWCGTQPCGASGGQPKHFTGKERDVETGLDYFGARYYASQLGRFTTLDPVYTWQDNSVDPQRWNRYAYVRNNPLKHIDPDGRVLETPWDAFNVSVGVVSLWGNLRQGNVVAASVDLVGLVYDVASTATPGLPGGGATLINSIRAADRVRDVARATSHGADAAGLVNRLDEVPITMDEAIKRGAEHVNGTGVVETTGRGTNFQFRNTTTDAAGNTQSSIARFDVNPADPHVQRYGPHLNLERHVNGRSVVRDPHTPIDPTTVRRGDTP
jgi:RHS repeat-associated protein